MTFKERVEQYSAARVVAEKALRRYTKAITIAEQRKAEWKSLSEEADQALRNLKVEAEAST